ncbi:MAG: EI24 domain-containing protein [Rhodospirillum sp.]|nr:EI24 domain-containing protein [Rhodospirillum sp.]MCF8487900.1 EI24 domain-containing protein [Rhodospirillum sp.]MCF8501452.1 EI24 domain-containing protein [Rhodospirillum sp.]
MFSALTKAFGQLGDPRIRKVLLLSLGLTLLGYLALVAGLSFLATLIKATDIGWLDNTIDWLAGTAVVFVALLFFPALVTLISSLFLEEVADAVDIRHYPALPPPRRIPLLETLLSSVKFTLVVVFLNIVVLPLYLIPGLGLFLFYGLNGYLLSREYLELVAHRRMAPREARALRSRYQASLWLLGAATAFLTTIPILNLLAPIVGTAAMVHLVETLRRKDAARLGA